MITEILLFIIALSEFVRLYSLFQKRGKLSYFKNRLQGVDQSVWDAEFQRYKAKEIREGVRMDMTALKSKQDILKQEYQERLNKNPALSEETRKGFLERLDRLNDAEKNKLAIDDENRKFKDQLEVLEVKINKLIYGVGRPKLKEDGTVDEIATRKLIQESGREADLCLQAMDDQLNFLNEKIGSLHELKSMVKDYLVKEL